MRCIGNSRVGDALALAIAEDVSARYRCRRFGAMAVSRSYCAAIELRPFNGFMFLSIPTQRPIKIQLAIEPHRAGRPELPAAYRRLVDGARDQCRCLTLC